MDTNNKKKTLVIGGSINPARYSNMAINLLREYDHPVVSVGLRKGKVADVEIETGEPGFEDIDTVTMYVGPPRQPVLYNYILGLKPKRIVFNPGTENEEFREMAENRGIDVVHNCTLVMLNNGIY
jgi:predicted CoA-binding protein